MYGLDATGALSHTQSFRIRDVGGVQSLEPPKPIDEDRIASLTATISRMRAFNRRVFDILPRLHADVAAKPSGMSG